jgi:hypothetical protein
MADDIVVIVSLDTEEDNWNRSRTDVTVANIRELRRLSRVFTRWGVRPTYFTAYQVAIDPCAVQVMREVANDSGGEIGAHLHPWNTPPLLEEFVPRNSMTKNLPPDLQLAKIRTLTRTLEEAFGRSPTSFRAGRYGIGPDTIAALVSCGYRVDSSVSPFVSLEGVDDGPRFVGAPIVPYRLAPHGDVRQPVPDGPLIEVPLSYGFNRGPFGFWDRTRRVLEARPLRWLHLAGLAARAGFGRRVSLSPEYHPVADMLTLSKQLLGHGARHLHVSWHTPSLKPGLSPFAATAADVDRLYGSIEAYFEGLAGLATFRFVTVSEAAAALLVTRGDAPVAAMQRPPLPTCSPAAACDGITRAPPDARPRRSAT